LQAIQLTRSGSVFTSNSLANGGQSIGASQNPSDSSACNKCVSAGPDQDNDGILDEDENNCISCDASIPVANGSFENNPAPGTFGVTDQSNLPGWQTTAADGQVEVWASGFLGVPAQSGNYFMELNANLESSLFQSLCLFPGTEIEWSICHRGRQGVDVAEIKIGADLASCCSSGTIHYFVRNWNRFRSRWK